jgi:hypothetical protein
VLLALWNEKGTEVSADTRAPTRFLCGSEQRVNAESVGRGPYVAHKIVFRLPTPLQARNTAVTAGKPNSRKAQQSVPTSSHVAMISHPTICADVIDTAAKATS